jgi:hypothetical protein
MNAVMKFETKPPTAPGLRVPKKSPIRLPIAAPHAPAGTEHQPQRDRQDAGNTERDVPWNDGNALEWISTAA